MPRMNGFEVLKAMKDDPELSKISVIILTNHDEIENEINGLDLGAVDYIRKPLNMASTRKRVEVHLNLRRAQNQIEDQNRMLEFTVYNRTKELITTRDITIRALVGLLEVRNIESSNHAKKNAVYDEGPVRASAAHAGLQGSPYRRIRRRTVQDCPAARYRKGSAYRTGSCLNRGKLDANEFENMKNHTTYGVLALSHDLPGRRHAHLYQNRHRGRRIPP